MSNNTYRVLAPLASGNTCMLENVLVLKPRHPPALAPRPRFPAGTLSVTAIH